MREIFGPRESPDGGGDCLFARRLAQHLLDRKFGGGEARIELDRAGRVARRRGRLTD
jgi:hypothetical protein